jgi:hypothetical protein
MSKFRRPRSERGSISFSEPPRPFHGHQARHQGNWPADRNRVLYELLGRRP